MVSYQTSQVHSSRPGGALLYWLYLRTALGSYPRGPPPTPHSNPPDFHNIHTYLSRQPASFQGG